MSTLIVAEPGAVYGAPAAPVPVPQMRALLDVNVLIALLDVDHLHHRQASDWLAENLEAGWASCAVTQNACVRIMSQPGYPNALPAARVAERLRQAVLTVHHRFIVAAPSLLEVTLFDTEQLLGPRQITDAWLLGLAVANEMRLVTFDGGVATRIALHATPAHLLVL